MGGLTMAPSFGARHPTNTRVIKTAFAMTPIFTINDRSFMNCLPDRRRRIATARRAVNAKKAVAETQPRRRPAATAERGFAKRGQPERYVTLADLGTF